jgi:6-phosphogluconolactonase
VSLLHPGPEGLWSQAHQLATSGSTPCFGSVTPDGRELWVAHFRDLKPNPAGLGSLAVIGLDSDAVPTGLLHRFEHEGSGVHPDRQTNSHPHCVVAHPGGRFVAVCDLGNDRVFVYDRTGPEPVRSFELGFPDLTGPRHGAFNRSGDRFHLMTEISNTLHTMRFDSPTGELELLSSCHVGNAGPDAPHSGADLALSPDGRTVFASLRAENRIAIVRGGQIAGAIEKGIANPRSIALSPDGQWLVSGNLSAQTVSVYRVQEDPAAADPAFELGEVKACCLAFAGGDT